LAAAAAVVVVAVLAAAVVVAVAAVVVVAAVAAAEAAVAAGGKNHEQEENYHEQNKLNSSLAETSGDCPDNGAATGNPDHCLQRECSNNGGHYAERQSLQLSAGSC
jgi:Tfp pilus assembly protein PilE